MKNLEIDTLVKLYENSNDSGKKILVDTYGESMFTIDNNYMEVFQGFCKQHNLIFDDIVPFKDPKTSNQHSTNAHAMLQEIVPIENEGWTPNWDNSSEYKYYPWFEMRSDWGFAFYGVDYWSTSTVAGSRLCFKNAERCELTAKKYLSIYQKWISK